MKTKKFTRRPQNERATTKHWDVRNGIDQDKALAAFEKNRKIGQRLGDDPLSVHLDRSPTLPFE